MAHYDVLIIGAGAGGGVVAGVLAEAGKRVLILERGREQTFAEIGRDHLRNQRLSAYGVNAGPDMDGNPRTMEHNGEVLELRPNHGLYHNNAAIVGGGTRVYGAQAWRFMPQDFRMATEYGVPEGSSLADWPFDYNEIEPYYERAEWEIGVCGENTAMTHLPDYNKPYPMPAQAPNRQAEVVRAGAASLGWDTLPIPLLINSVPYNDRPACIRCQHCVGFPCPVDAKNGSQNTMIARAKATGNCTIVTEAMVERLTVSDNGRVTGAAYYAHDGARVEVTADVVVVSAGAIESARLLLNSAHSGEPDGIGNASDQVGRHIQGHYYPSVAGLFEDRVWDMNGPGATTATCKFNHGNDGIIGGGMLADDFIVLPINFWKLKLPPRVPRWGAANKQFMRENYRRMTEIRGPVHEIPTPDARVQRDPQVKDKWGIPVARLSGQAHPETIRTSNFMFERAKEWLTAAGAVEIWGQPPGFYFSAGQHQAGTCRMGDDPATSVVDRWGRVHGHENLFVADASLNVTNGGFNPVLTILALAFRTADHIAASW